MMEKLLIEFVQLSNQAYQIKPLLKNTNLIVELNTVEEKYFIVALNGRLELESHTDRPAHLIIKGSDYTIVNLIMGHEKLTSLQKSNQIDVQGSLRNRLKLESILYCNAKKPSSINYINSLTNS